jgi:hypothetical protein
MSAAYAALDAMNAMQQPMMGHRKAMDYRLKIKSESRFHRQCQAAI